MKNTCWKLFSYLAIDHGPAQDFLNSMARQGWALNWLWAKPLVRFKRTERRDLRYFLDWADPKHTEDAEYLHLCEDAGWVFVERCRYWNIYVSRPGISPAPIQTDPSVEYNRFREKVLWRMAVGAGLVVLLLAVYASLLAAATWDWGSFFVHTLTTNFTIPFLVFLLPFWGIGGLSYLFLLAHRLHAWKRSLLDGTSPPSPQAPNLWKNLSALLSLSWFLLFILVLADSLFNHRGNWGVPIGLIISGIIVLTRNDYPVRQVQRQALSAFIIAGLFTLSILLNGPIRSVFPGRLPPAPIVSSNWVDDGRYSKVTRSDGFVGSEATWWEREVDPTTSPSNWNLFSVSAQTWISTGFAEKALEKAVQGLSPVPGYDNIWFQAWDNQYHILFFRGTTLLNIHNYDWTGPIQDAPIFSGALSWLEQMD